MSLGRLADLGAPRLLLAAIAGLHAVNALLVLTTDSSGMGRPFHALMVNGFVSGLAGLLALVLAADLVRRGRAGALWASTGLLAALALAFLLSYAWSPLSGFHPDAVVVLFAQMVLWAAFTVPPAALAAGYADAKPLALSVGAGLLFLGLLAPGLYVDAAIQRGTFDESDRPALEEAGNPWRVALEGLAQAAFAGALAWGTVRAAGYPAPFQRAAFRPSASWAAGAAILVGSWVFGGDAWGMPLWLVPLALLGLPDWRPGRDRRRSALVGVLLLAGAVPAWECTRDPWTDVASPDGRDLAPPFAERVALAELAFRGPGWREGGGFGGSEVRCSAGALLAGFAWLGGFLAASAWQPLAGGRRDPTPAAP